METLGVDLIFVWRQWIWPLLEFIIGLGLVIFIHEAGHFIIAKAVKIKVEQFALGFGPRLFGFRSGETDYRINLLPMGGYVKMLGQEDFTTLKEDDKSDPRAFFNKSVGARLGVVSAGVVMNVILAGVLFILVCLIGIRFPAPVIGRAMFNSPADDAVIHWQKPGARRTNESKKALARSSLSEVTKGFKPGDRIIKVNDKEISRFMQLATIAALADPDEKFRMTIERRKDHETQIGNTEIGVIPEDGHLMFGFSPALSTTFGGLGNYIADDSFQEGDRLLEINGHKIQNSWQIDSVEKNLKGGPATVKVLRGKDTINITVRPALRIDGGVFFLKDGSTVKGRLISFSEEDNAATLRLADNEEMKIHLGKVIWPARSEILDMMGLVPRLRIAGIVEGSPANRAGLKPGDIIEAYGDIRTPTVKQFLDFNEKVVEAGTEIVVIRKGKKVPPLPIRPERHKGRVVVGINLGLDNMLPVIAFVRGGSPAAGAGMMRGDIVHAVNGKRISTWLEFFDALKDNQGRELTIVYQRSGLPGQTAHFGILTRKIFNPEDYYQMLFPGPRGFTVLMGEKVRKGPISAIVWGARETWDFIVMTYASLTGFFKGTVSYKEFSGPVGIGSMAVQVGREGFVEFMYFMAIISISLAVLNFLPFPVVDGGIAVLLLIEKIRGKPLSVEVRNSLTMIGWMILLFIFFALTWHDIAEILRNLW